MKTMKLNLLMSYSPGWTKSQIMNNFVQNFYDALGCENFQNGFRYYYEDKTLTLKSDVGFSKEWLYYFGASSKQSGGSYAGGFGEGFKLAALTAFRDYHIDIVMESQDWSINVMAVPEVVAGKQVEFFGYEIGERPYQENTILRLTNADRGFLECTEVECVSFYYKENPLFGECIWDNGDSAIYETKRTDRNVSGRLYASYEMRGTLSIPLIICNHVFTPERDDRDRKGFDQFEMEACIEEVFSLLSPNYALSVLEKVQCIWSAKTKESRRSGIDWNDAIKILIWKVSSNAAIADTFYKKYGGSLLVSGSVNRETDAVKEKLARMWFRSFPEKNRYRFVRDSFRSLGIMTIVACCDKHGGFVVEREPDDIEAGYIRILQRAARSIIGDILCLDRWPTCLVLTDDRIPVFGYTKVSRKTGKKNAYGLKVQAAAEHVYIQSSLLQRYTFADAFTTYAHELLHQYGGDTSMQFHRALFLMDERIVSFSEEVERFEEEWILYGAEQSKKDRSRDCT